MLRRLGKSNIFYENFVIDDGPIAVSAQAPVFTWGVPKSGAYEISLSVTILSMKAYLS